MDRTLGFLFLICILPTLLAVALAVRIKLGRGVIYRQTRIGVGGQPFTMFKFRSMRPDLRTSQLPFAGEDRRTSHKTASDPRHTPFGRFLRKTSLDELPQFWNVVVRGDMSLVGPRPELASVVATYDPWQHQRHLVKPGLTGLWQVHHRHKASPMRDDTDIDLTYIRELSIGADLRILLATVPVVLGRTGS
jgi:lipopolysaccharide/colanic/teichoic acid biosynthesis glycosyltransferase